MTDEQIIEAIATKVMGWTRKDGYLGAVWEPTPTLCTLWNPLRNPADSKQVREKLAEQGWNYDLGRYGYIPALFTFELRRSGVQHVVNGDSEERVTCDGALKTVEQP